MLGNKEPQPRTLGPSPATGAETRSDSSRPASATVRAAAWLGPSLRVKGEISGNEDLHVEGKVEGPVSLGGHRLTVGRSAEVIADITAREVVTAISARVIGSRSRAAARSPATSPLRGSWSKMARTSKEGLRSTAATHKLAPTWIAFSLAANRNRTKSG